MNNRFDIGIENPTPDKRGVALGFLTAGEFHEHFPLLVGHWTPSQYQRQWQDALSSLVKGKTPVALMCQMWSADPDVVRLAWILYRDGDRVFIQQNLMMPESSWQVDANGHLISFEPRQTQAEDGDPISEWQTDVDAIKSFLKSVNQMAANNH